MFPAKIAAGREAVAAELEELEGRQVEGDAVGEEGVEEDGVPRALLALEERTAVADEDAVVGVGAEVEVLLGDADDLGVDLDGGRRDLGSLFREEAREHPGPEADDEGVARRLLPPEEGRREAVGVEVVGALFPKRGRACPARSC